MPEYNIFIVDKLSLNDTYEEFLENINLNHEDYLNIIRANLKKTKVFLKRNLNEIMINNYNTKILQVHQANMDIQFILDMYACILYILNYINKSDRGMSKLLRNVQKDVRFGNTNQPERLRQIMNVYTSSTEISAQEIVYYLLGMPVSECSRVVEFINTNKEIDRVHLVKHVDVLDTMDPNDTDLCSIDSIEYYT